MSYDHQEEIDLDPVTFEVLRNSFSNLVDRMAQQTLRTCYSFVLYNRDFSNCMNNPTGDTVAQGSQDIAAHVGTLHNTCKEVIDYYDGDINPGDIILSNDPYRGGTHINDTRVFRPVFHEGKLIAFMQSNGHWADVGGPNPGSYNIEAKEIYAEGMRVPPVKIYREGEYQEDVANMIVSNMRVSDDRLGDMRAQTEATRVGEQRLLELIEKYGRDTVLTAFDEVQDYVERIIRKRLSELPDGTWTTTDHLDSDPSADEGLIPIEIEMTIDGDEVTYDFEGSHEYVGSFLNDTYGMTYSGVVAATKMFFPDVPLNSGMYRVLNAEIPEDTVVNVKPPVAATGGPAGAFEKVMNGIFELWSEVMPERAMACTYNIEYLLVGGKDNREISSHHPAFMWFDYMPGGWGGRNGKDGSNATSPIFGASLTVQPLEGQERDAPLVTSEHSIITDSGGPGKWRGGCGVRKGGRLTDISETVMGYCTDRERAVTWGINGGQPGLPQGTWLNPDAEDEEYLGIVFSNEPVEPDDRFLRPSSGGGGYGDPLERDPEKVREDVIDDYVSIERAKKDYGVVIEEIDPKRCEYEIDWDATEQQRQYIREHREEWLEEDPQEVAQRYRDGDLSVLDLVRRYGVIIDRKSETVLERTTEQYREMLDERMVDAWGG